MQVAIIEDEKLAAERLQEMLCEIEPSIQILAKLESVADAVAWLQNHQPDLIFLDIQLADGLSFAIFDHVHINIPIIFTTAYDEYAIKAFKLNSIDYLLKPIRQEDLQKSLLKYENMQQLFSPDIKSLLASLQPEQKSHKKRFIVQFGDRIKNIEVEKIAYFYALEKYTFLTTQNNETFSIDFSLDKLQDLLDPEIFFRINRKIIINYTAIKGMIALSRSRIKIELMPAAPKAIQPVVSIERSNSFKKWIDK